MGNPSIIPTNFRVPKGLRHEWVLFYEKEVIGTLHGVPGRKQVRQGFREPSHYPLEMQPRLESQTLDWITESMMHLRRLCGAP